MDQTEDVLGVWHMRVDGIRRRTPKWILGSFWAPPLIILLPIMAAYFSDKMISGAAIAAGAFICYSLLAYLYWYRQRSNRDHSAGLWLILIVLGYDGLGLHLISIGFLAFSIFSIRNSTDFAQLPILGIVFIYLVELVVISVRGGHILRYISTHLSRPLPPEMAWLLGAPAGAAGFAVAFAAITRGKLEQWVVVGLLGALGTFLSAPFAALTFYQIPLFLLWHERARLSIR